ncbi:MAG: DUF4012 domain-containing protein [Patescibacteria group bacterium]
MPKQKILLSLFDVRPKDESGSVDVEKLEQLPRVVNLRTSDPSRKSSEKSLSPPLAPLEAARPRLDFSDDFPSRSPQASLTQQLVGETPLASDRDIVAKEIEDVLNQDAPLVADLVRAGGTLHEQRQQKPARPRLIKQAKQQQQPPIEIPEAKPQETNSELEAFWKQETPRAVTARASYEPHYHNPFPAASLPAPVTHLSPAARDVEVWLERLKTESPKRPSKTLKHSWIGRLLNRRVLAVTIIGFVSVVGFGVAAVSSGEINAKQSVLENGDHALANLEKAKGNLEELRFGQAADDFALAYGDFDQAAGTLNNFGASFLSLFGNLPGLGKIKSANNLVEAGRNISKAGENLSRAFQSVSQTNFLAMLDPNSDEHASLAKPLADFQDVLEDADRNIRKAGNLLNDVDPATIPAEKRELFEDFRDKIPSFQAYLDQALGYSDSLLALVGPKQPRTYMVLLQNNSERRPTGGFPGTYAIISFDQGVLTKVFVDDIYNPDGQIKANIIPPGPIQHITPNLGLRDACWFADFPSCAKKVQEYYKLDGGGPLDGVLAVTPTVIARILKVTGPVELPAYKLTLGADNFLAEIQDEVEYKGDRAHPKKIVVDFQPAFFAKLADQDKEHWLEIAKILLDAMKEKHVLAYFNTPGLERDVKAHGFGGELRDAKGDYLQVAFSNVKGAKADAVTSNAMRLATQLKTDGIAHTLSITRAHNGGDSKYAFYNKELPAYVKVYVPQGAVLDHMEGFATPNYKPLINYEELGFKHDPELAAVEATMRHPMPGVDMFEESGKTVIGFWMITKPRKTSSVSITYHILKDTLDLGADKYTLLWQKQSGTDGDHATVSIQIPDGKKISQQSDGIQLLGANAVLDTDLSVDREVKVVLN